MVSTRTRSAAAEARKKPALHDITNDGKGGAKRKSAGGQIADAGPQTAAKEEVPVAARTRSTRKKESAVAGRADIIAKFAAGQKGDVPAEALEAKFERAADGDATGKKRKPLEPIQHEAPKLKEKRLTRAASRKDADGVEAIVDPDVIDLTCDERLISERGLILATGGDVGAAEDVYPFSVDGGRRLNEKRIELQPYVTNGQLFSIKMRQDLVDWMSQQHSTLELVDETLHLAIRYLDTFLNRRGTESFLARNGAGSEPVPAIPLQPLQANHVLYLNNEELYQPLCNKLKRLGITCIFVAAKVTEVSSPSAHEFADAAEVVTFTRSQLLLAEKALLRELGYFLYHPTPSSFAGAYLARLMPGLRKEGLMEPRAREHRFLADGWNTNPCEDVSEIVDYLLEASTMAHGSLQFSPSAVAAAAVSYTLEKIWGVRWDSMRELHKMSGYTKHDLAKVYAFFDRLISDAYDSEELGRGLHINDKHQNATSILWRKAFFTIGSLDEGS